MNKRLLIWLGTGVVSLAIALWLWRTGFLEKAGPATASVGRGSSATAAAAGTRRVQDQKTTVRPASTAPLVASQRASTNSAPGTAPKWKDALRYRLSNTHQTVDQLARNPRGILLANALIDSSRALDLNIPADLQAHGAPGSYIVQSKGPIDDSFRTILSAAGASVVSYIPNNAYLVSASASQARQLQANPQTAAVLPFEPYYKLDDALLKLAVKGEPLAPGSALNVVVFGGAEQTTAQTLAKMGLPVLGQSRSPFGPVFTVQFNPQSAVISPPSSAVRPPPSTGVLAAIAQLPGVQLVEPAPQRSVSDDLSRALLGVSADTVTPTNYLNLTGSNVVVAVNDSGVDANHPDLTGRVFSEYTAALTDTNGHGTFVAGVIAGNGSESTTVTNAAGSVMPAVAGQFRGMAPAADIYSLPAATFGLLDLSDFQLEEAAARTNALISNNSWNYSGNEYDIEAANYDQAVRDALPEVTGSQPLTIVFSAGNSGSGDDNSGQGGDSDSILSPATAKNVITVGALEQPRNITNNVVDANGNTNQPWAAETSSADLVAGYSSRGNVGIGTEGDFGRFKPDLVAPGTFVISDRSTEWDQAAYYNPTSYHDYSFSDTVNTNAVNGYAIYVPDNAVRITISATNVDVGGLPIYLSSTAPPTTNDTPAGYGQVTVIGPNPRGGIWFYGVGNPTNVPLSIEVQTELVTTNDLGNYLDVLSNLNDTIGPYYRYETGTSMAAADVSGMLALLEDFFTNHLGVLPSPALLKAMLINGARSAGPQYDMAVDTSINFQGWGLPSLMNSLPASLATNSPGAIESELTNGPSPLLLFDQNTNTALATGQRRTILISVTNSAQSLPLRVTLVWTDPPGNPAAGTKLVNNLDLVVTNLDDPSLIYFGNNINSGNNFSSPWDTNSPPNRDVVNNVENVYLAPPLATNYSITVIGRDVNVNAVTAQTNNVSQDYALVVSSGGGEVPGALTVEPGGGTVSAPAQNLTVMTNQFPPGMARPITGQLLENQEVGANFQLLGTNTIPLVGTQWGTNGAITLGVTNQWHFYVLTNDLSYTNAAFMTFDSAEMGVPPMGTTNVADPPTQATRPEADIDLYVSQDPGLLSLAPAAVESAFKSTRRGGTEWVAITNALPGTYYIGVKSEDQEAAQYSFFGVFSLLPFSSTSNGVETVYGINVPAPIPDGSPAKAGVVHVLGLATQPMLVRRVVVTNVVTHQNFGDLLGDLSHDGTSVVLNNHSYPNFSPISPDTYLFTYDDSGEVSGALHSDGPGNLTDFMGKNGPGPWILTEVDNAPGNTGTVDSVSIQLSPQVQGTGLQSVNLTAPPNSWTHTQLVIVPYWATNLSLWVVNNTPSPNGALVVLYVKRNAPPTQNDYTYTPQPITWPGSDPNLGQPPSEQIDLRSLPPLSAGTYHIRIYNPSPFTQSLTLSWLLKPTTFSNVPTVDFTSAGPVPILDDAVSYSTIDVTNDEPIVEALVGVAIDHPRVSDLVLTLISPSGQRYLLMENRGGGSAMTVSSQTNATTVLNNNFETPGASTYGVGASVDSWTVTSNEVSVVNDPLNAAFGSQYLTLADGSINCTLPTIVGRKYTLTFAYRGPGILGMWRGENNAVDSIAGNNGTIRNIGFTNGVVGRAFACDPENYPFGTYNGVDIPDQPAYALTNSLTIEGWIRPRGNSYNIFWRGDNRPGWDPYSLSMQDDSTLAFYLENQAGTGFAATYPLAYGSWYHVAATLNGSSGAVRLYVNGGFKQFSTTVRPFGSLIPSDSPGIGIGNLNDGQNNFPFIGDIDEISLYSRALSRSEVDAIYSLESAGIPKFDSSGSVSLPSALAEAEVSVGGVSTNMLVGNNMVWQTNVITFIATQSGTPVRISGLEPGMLIDAVNLAQESGPEYLVFTDDTNLAQVPIKFAVPPFQTMNLSSASGWIQWPVNGHWYKAVADNTVDWNEADQIARNAGAHLATITSAAENAFVFSLIDSPVFFEGIGGNGSGPALGGIQPDGSVEPAGGWTWETGEPWSYTNWSPVQPDNGLCTSPTCPNLESRLEFWSGTQGVPASTWNDLAPTDPNLGGYVMEIDQLRGPYYLPEQSLQPLVGQSAQGAWTLEIRDDRAGDNLNASLVSWQMQFIFANNAVPIGLTGGVNATNSIPPCNMAEYAVDVPAWATYATNVLVSASVPVQVWFNQNQAPVGDPAQGDIPLIPATAHTYTTSGTYTLTTNGVPPLVPGARYYLGVTNLCANGTNADVVLRVDFNRPMITLTNAIPYLGANQGGTNDVNDYYHFVVSNGMARAQFEIDNPTGPMELAVRRGQPADLTTHDYLSDNPGTNDQLIVVLTNSTPVALTPGDWYLTAVNISGGPVSYSIMATEWPTTGQPITITGVNLSGAGTTNSSFCITWSSLPGAYYYIEGVTNLNSTNWDVITPTIPASATGTNTTYCVPLPSPYHFFRVVEGLSPGVSAQLVPAPALSASWSGSGILLQWTGPLGAKYWVQWASSLASGWNTLPTPVTSSSNVYVFLDDGSQTGGLGGQRFYRVVVAQ